MRVVVISDPSQLNTSYRAFQPAHALALNGHEVGIQLVEEPMLREDQLQGYDLVHVYRYSLASTQQLVKRLKHGGAAIMWDNDDDLTSYPSDVVESRVRGALRSQKMASRIRPMLRFADVVTTPSPVLAAAYREGGAAEVRVIENFVAREFLAAEPLPHDGIVIGWTAAMEHLHDLRELGLRETLQRVLDAHPDVRVSSVGIDLDLGRDRYRSHGWVEFKQLPDLVAEFDIGLAPIADEPFNRARSNIKLKEYASLGIPWLASPIGPYAQMGERQGGRLVANERWYEELERLITKRRERKKLAKAAARWARDQTLEQQASQWVDAATAAVERRATAGAAIAYVKTCKT